MNNRLLRPLIDAVRQVYLFLFTRGQDQVVTQSGDLLRAEQTVQSNIYGAGMPVTITELPAGTADPDATVAADNATGTITQKIRLGDIAGVGAPAAHNQAWSTITSTPTSLSGYGITDGVATSDARLTDSREWSAATATQAEAEAGTSTTRLAFTPQRIFQAIAAWWSGSAAKTKLDGIATGATANSTDAQLRDRATHTGTQAASTITGLATVATTGAYANLTGTPSLGTIATQNANAVAITGGTINGTSIGATTASTGAFTTVTTTGNVGIGTASPAARLDVRRTNAYVLFCDSFFSTALFGPREVNDGFCTVQYSWTTQANGGAENWQQDFSSTLWQVGRRSGGTFTSGMFAITSTGNVGIGTASPVHRLDVSGQVRATGAQDPLLVCDATNNQNNSIWFTKNGTARWYVWNSDATNAFNIGNPAVNPCLTVTSTGNVGIGTASPAISSGVGLHLSGSTLRLGTARTPASATATGNTGEICWDASYLYICTATNTWRRIAHSTW